MSSHLVQPCCDNMQSKLLNRPAMTSSKPGRSDNEEALAKNPNTTTSSTTTTSYSVKNGNVGLAPSSHHANYSINLAFKMLTQHMPFAFGTGLHIAAVIFMLTWCIYELSRCFWMRCAMLVSSQKRHKTHLSTNV